MQNQVLIKKTALLSFLQELLYNNSYIIDNKKKKIERIFVTKLIIQIPCFNESLTLLETLNDLPKNVEGIDELEVLVINDGSTDNTETIARNWGAKVLNIKPNRGLANAFKMGLQECLKLGADIIVNTDGDNQYRSTGIENLIKPILNNTADITIGARKIETIEHFSITKKILQKLGSATLRLLSSTEVQDAPSGFRAFSKNAALKINIFDNYTYTMETIIQAGAKGLRIISVPCDVNPPTRKSHLFKNIFIYVFRSMKTIIRMFIVYRPFRFFISMASILAILGMILVARFIWFFSIGDGNGHIQSLIFAAIFLISSMQVGLIAIIGDLLSINRKLMEDVQTRIKKLELK
jgi:glycosyltransferase involved in cell wall biosynthesis